MLTVISLAVIFALAACLMFVAMCYRAGAPTDNSQGED